MSSIKCGNCKATHTSVSEVRNCYAGTLVKRPISVEVGITQAEINRKPVAPVARTNRFAGRCAKCSGWVAAEAGILGERVNGKWLVEHAECPASSRPIYVEAADGSVGRASSAVAPATEPEDGIYITPNEDIFKVYCMVHGSRRQGAKRLEFSGDGKTGKFVYQGLASRHLPGNARRMSREEAAAFGKLYGFCVRCGRTLTDENSIAAGIGPVCAGYAW